MGMEAPGSATLERTSSQASSLSVKSRGSETVRRKSRKHVGPSPTSATVDKGLTSFPSLSPDRPRDRRVHVPNNVRSLSASSQSPARPTVNALTVSTSSLSQRTALFADSPLGQHLVPGTLHRTTDEHIERLVATNGAVALIRQLAEDLAQRDAQMSALQRRAEEREKVLRKMLLDCEVSNMDIEARLRKGLAEYQTTNHSDAVSSKRAARDEVPTSAVGGVLHEMMDQAMKDPVGPAVKHTGDVPAVDPTTPESDQATIRARASRKASDDRTRSTRSVRQGHGRPRGNSRAWVDYLWPSNGTSRKSSRSGSVIGEAEEDNLVNSKRRTSAGVMAQRKALQSDLFHPPDDTPASLRSASGESQVNSIHSKNSSSSVASWAVKLVAGNARPGLDDQRNKLDQTPKGRTPSGHSRRSSNAAGKPMDSALAALNKINNTILAGRWPPSTGGGGSGGSTKGSLSIKSSNIAPSPIATSGITSPINSGPVEMDTILPPDSQPPTLTQTYNNYHPTEFLTDRFGFIYDRRTRLSKRNAIENISTVSATNSKLEMLSPAGQTFGMVRDADKASIDSANGPASSSSDSRPGSPASVVEDGQAKKPGKRWQDYLKIATFPTELLSHTPAGGGMPNVEVPDLDGHNSSQITIVHSGTILPRRLNPQPAASPIVADNVTFAKRASLDPTNPDPEAARLLLEQLTELHDSLQRERTVKWNDFLRKVRAERQKEGETAAEGKLDSRLMPESVLADGEMVGVAGLGNKGKVGRAKWNEFKRLVLNGIPVAYRAKIWAECSGASALKTPGYYDDLIENGVDDPVVVAQISVDIKRTLTDNIFFREGPGVEKLNEVLLAYSRRNPDIGYCQGMNLIAASLLLIMPSAEDAFWVMTSMIETILPPNYYDHSLLASRADQQVLRQYVAQVLPRLSAHLDNLNVELEALTFQWFLSVFTGCLSAEALFRVWDVVLCTNDGSTFLFQVALALLSLNEQHLLSCSTPATVYSYINHQMTNHAISIDGLIHASDALKKVVTRAEVEERRSRVVEAERNMLRERERSIKGKTGGKRRGTSDNGSARVAEAPESSVSNHGRE